MQFKGRKHLKSACWDVSSGSVIKNKSLNSVDTVLHFKLKTLSLPRGCQSTARANNLPLCQKQIHKEKTTIQNCIISLRDEGTEGALSDAGKVALVGIV